MGHIPEEGTDVWKRKLKESNAGPHWAAPKVPRDWGSKQHLRVVSTMACGRFYAWPCGLFSASQGVPPLPLLVR